MDVAVLPRSTLLWALGLVVLFPVSILFLGELIPRLKRRGLPLTSTLSILRNLVLPILGVLVLLIKVVELPMGHTASRVVLTLFWIALIHAALSFVTDVVFSKAEEGTWRERVPKLLLDLARVVLVLIGAAIVLSTVWDFNLASLATALGVGSLVIGLALQEPLGNVFAGIMLLFERPFKIGDWIKVDTTAGRVTEINWRAVHLETLTRELRVVPNSVIAKSAFSNFSRPARVYCQPLDLGFSYDHRPTRSAASSLKCSRKPRTFSETPLP